MRPSASSYNRVKRPCGKGICCTRAACAACPAAEAPYGTLHNHTSTTAVTSLRASLGCRDRGGFWEREPGGKVLQAVEL